MVLGSLSTDKYSTAMTWHPQNWGNINNRSRCEDCSNFNPKHQSLAGVTTDAVSNLHRPSVLPTVSLWCESSLPFLCHFTVLSNTPQHLQASMHQTSQRTEKSETHFPWSVPYIHTLFCTLCMLCLPSFLEANLTAWSVGLISSVFPSPLSLSLLSLGFFIFLIF